jgi:broad specificity phosphatase PhoE
MCHDGLEKPSMRSAEFEHRGYTIRTFAVHGEVRARAFREGSWLRDVPDTDGESLEDALRRMHHALDIWEAEEAGTASGEAWEH